MAEILAATALFVAIYGVVLIVVVALCSAITALAACARWLRRLAA